MAGPRPGLLHLRGLAGRLPSPTGPLAERKPEGQSRCGLWRLLPRSGPWHPLGVPAHTHPPTTHRFGGTGSSPRQERDEAELCEAQHPWRLRRRLSQQNARLGVWLRTRSCDSRDSLSCQRWKNPTGTSSDQKEPQALSLETAPGPLTEAAEGFQDQASRTGGGWSSLPSVHLPARSAPPADRPAGDTPLAAEQERGWDQRAPCSCATH